MAPGLRALLARSRPACRRDRLERRHTAGPGLRADRGAAALGRSRDGPGALLAYAWLGPSRTLVVSATTSTSALSAAAIGPLADGDMAKFAALSAALAIVAGVVLAAAGVLRLGGVMDFVSKPVMTGFLFGLGLTVAIG